MSAKQTPAERRRAAYDRRIKVATTDRRRLHALVWWWLSEINSLPIGRRKEAVACLEQVVADLNERKAA